jgi:hypothetical protein
MEVWFKSKVSDKSFILSVVDLIHPVLTAFSIFYFILFFFFSVISALNLPPSLLHINSVMSFY